MRRYILLLVLALCGCKEDKERQIAKCRLESEKMDMDLLEGTQHVVLCMKADGYNFSRSYYNCNLANANGELPYFYGACYRPDGIFGKITDW